MSTTSPANANSVAATSFVKPNPPRWGWKGLVQLLMVALIIALACGSVVFVDETEMVIVERFGVITAVYDQVDPARSDRGLHVKLPWPIESVRRFDRRLQLFDPRGREMFTRDRKNIVVDTYLCWRIAPGDSTTGDLADRPVVKFYRSLGSISATEARLDSLTRSVLSAEMGRLALSDLLVSTDSESGPQTASPLARLSERVQENIKAPTDEFGSLKERLGIEIVDLGIQRINLPEGNLFAVYERMRKERDKIAQRYRSAGEAEKLVLESQARRRSAEILARAQTEAAQIRAAGEAESLKIRNAAHARDPQFYAWLRNIESYQKLLNNQTTLVLSASSPFLRVLMDGLPETTTKNPAPNRSGQPELPETGGR